MYFEIAKIISIKWWLMIIRFIQSHVSRSQLSLEVWLIHWIKFAPSSLASVASVFIKWKSQIIQFKIVCLYYIKWNEIEYFLWIDVKGAIWFIKSKPKNTQHFPVCRDSSKTINIAHLRTLILMLILLINDLNNSKNKINMNLQ